MDQTLNTALQILSAGNDVPLIDANGNVNGAAVLSKFYNQVEIRTAVTPSIIFPISAGGAPPDPTMQAVIRELQPTIIFRGPAGEQVVAPFGVSQGAGSWLPVAAVVAAVILGIGYFVYD